MGEPALWIAAAALALSAVVAIIGYKRNPAFMPASIVAELRIEVAELRVKVESLIYELEGLKSQLGMEIRKSEWYQEEYRKVKSELDKQK